MTELDMVCKLDHAQKKNLARAIQAAAHLNKPDTQAVVGVWGPIVENDQICYPPEAIPQSCQVFSLKRTSHVSVDRAIVYLPPDEFFLRDRMEPFIWAFRSLKPAGHMAVAAFAHPVAHPFGYWLETIRYAGFDPLVDETININLAEKNFKIAIITAYKS